MNLFVSGNLTAAVRARITACSDPSRGVKLHDKAFRFEDVDASQLARLHVKRLCEQAKVDYAFLPRDLTWANFRVLAIDMDSTLISIECIDEIAALAGRGDQIAMLTTAAMNGSKVEFSDSLRRRVSLLKGVSACVLQKVYEDKLRLNQGAEALLMGARAHGLKTALVSGGFNYFTKKLCERLSIDFELANSLITENCSLTGEVAEPIVDGPAKAAFVKSLLLQQDAPAAAAIVIGDGANDIDMMRIAGLSVAYRAKENVREYASCEIRYGPLSVILDWISN